MKIISLVRHGQASFGTMNYDQLSSKGVVQTQLLGDNYRQSGRTVHYLTSGEMSRQKDSLQHFLSHFYISREGIELFEVNHEIEVLPTPMTTLPILLPSDHCFNEFDHEQILFKANLGFNDKASFADFLANNKKPELTFAQIFAQAMQRWQSGEFDSDYDESWRQFQQRTWQGFQKVIEQTGSHEHSMVFTSGGVIATILQQVLGVSDQHAFDFNWQIANASVSQFLIKDAKIFLQSFNEFSYLYQQGEDMVTWR